MSKLIVDLLRYITQNYEMAGPENRMNLLYDQVLEEYMNLYTFEILTQSLGLHH